MFNSCIDQFIEIEGKLIIPRTTIFLALFDAIKEKNLEILTNFIKSDKFSVHDKNGHGNTVLCIAAEKNNLGAAKILVKYGADITALNGKGETPISLFTKHCNKKAIIFLLNKYLNSKVKDYELSPSFYETLHNAIEDIKTEDDLNIKNEKVQNFVHEFNIQVQNLHSLLELPGNDLPHWDTI
jgi:ankyrin repeat protein